ncbi:hypothetical protein QBC47DRAFT_407537 [Echria macrotheca]|uniref:Uncharacterized protein n=1 Tax=Echria macrotheca TaxID=438768 RepID=A0AAJ0B301_9PEZI|nr:hypothetical protein QBC47DRAFT_407537 [Echria macrotheca]
MEYLVLISLGVTAALRAPDVIKELRKVSKSRESLDDLLHQGRECQNHLQEVNAEIKRTYRQANQHQPRRHTNQGVPDDLYAETRNLIRYCDHTVEDMMTYHRRFGDSLRVKILHYLAMVKRSRTDVFDRRLYECALWLRIAATTVFLHANYDAAAQWAARNDTAHRARFGVVSGDILGLCQVRAQQLRADIAEALMPGTIRTDGRKMMMG